MGSQKGSQKGAFLYGLYSQKGNFWPPGSHKSNPGTVTVCCKRGASGQEKTQYIKYLHSQKKAGPERGSRWGMGSQKGF